MSDNKITLRSYRLAFELERRLHRIDRFRIPVPYGIPLAALAYAVALAALFVARRQKPQLALALLWIVIGFLGSLGLHFVFHEFLFGAVPGFRALRVPARWAVIAYLGMAMLITVLSLNAVHWDLSGLPPERTTLLGGPGSAIPWPTLFTGMIFSQLYYWSTNQTITQRALAAPSIREAKKGVYAAAAVRLLIIQPIVVRRVDAGLEIVAGERRWRAAQRAGLH